MKLQDLANLVIVRNHIYTLANSTRAVPNNKKNSFMSLAEDLDKLFLEDVEKIIEETKSANKDDLKISTAIKIDKPKKRKKTGKTVKNGSFQRVDSAKE